MALTKKQLKYRARLTGIVLALLTMVCGYCVLVTVQERYGYDFGLPQFQVPLLDSLFDTVEQLAGSGRTTAEMENAMAVSATPGTGGDLSVHMLDLGQADSALIIAPGATVLIDAGENHQGEQVLAYLREQGVERIDILIGTHPHSDHIGGMDTVIQGMEVGRVILPELPHELVPTTATYTDLLLAIDEAGLGITPAVPGDRYDLGGGATLTILGPLGAYGSLNDVSVISYISYGGVSFLFTGDAEKGPEADLVAAGVPPATVLSVGHHGSGTSSTQAFLDAVNPRIALISCGLDNSYGHPTRDVLQRLDAMGIRVLRTDLHGAVVLATDGERIGVQTQQEAA